MAVVFSATFNNMLTISWRLVEETTGLAQVTDKLYHIKLNSIHLVTSGIRIHNFSGLSTDCTDSCKSNYHTITGRNKIITKWNNSPYEDKKIYDIQENLKLFLSSIYLKAHFRLQSYLQHFKNELQGKLIFHFH